MNIYEKTQNINPTDEELLLAHGATHHNRKTLFESEKAGCIRCARIFDAGQVKDWVDTKNDPRGETAICPHCHLDSVIGDKSGYPITASFLQRMKIRWFTPNH